MKLVMATKNKDKVKEFKEILVGLDFDVVSILDYSDIEDVEETGSTFLDNSILKAKEYAKATGESCIADDSGLCVDALNGAPGVYSARFAANDDEKCKKLLKLMENMENRSARFYCYASIFLPIDIVNKLKKTNLGQNCLFSDDNPNIITCVGILEGLVAHEKKGDNGFGFDPVIFIPKYNKHLAELSSEEKNKISHRGQALSNIKELLSYI